MKITGVTTHLVDTSRWRNFVFVKVTTDEGIHGWGEATVEGKEKTVAEAVHELARYLVGKDPFQIELHWQAMYRNAFWVGGPILTSAISSVEHALWDIKGKAFNVPVWELLGGKMRDRVRAYANAWFFGATSPADFARCAEATVKTGYTALKWDPFGSAGLFIDNDQRNLAVQCVRDVRSAVGPDVDLCIEVHGRLSPANAIGIAHQLEELGIFFYEEPVPPENIDALALVTRSVGVRVATGERLYTKWGFKDVLEKQAAAVIQPDICHDGGILETRKIAAMAEVYYVGVAPHNPNGPVATAATVQVDACTPNFLIQEYAVCDDDLKAAITKEQIEIVDGYFVVPDRPGLGVDLDEEAMKRFPYRQVDMTTFSPDRDMRSRGTR
jgi:galactonate dehydratase